MQPRHRPAGKVAGLVAIVLAALSVVPSWAPFTPAVLIALLALLVAAGAAFVGELALSACTFGLVIAAVAGSPIFTLSALRESHVLSATLLVPFVAFLLAFARGVKSRHQR
jgi:hypothetical protein